MSMDEIYKQEKFEHILTRHEQAAVHAADGYARATGEVGVAMVTSGPGFTNAVTGLATAYTDSIPLVVISGRFSISIGTDWFPRGLCRRFSRLWPNILLVKV